MSIENAQTIDQLDAANPPDSAPKAEGAGQLRLLKSVLKNTFTGLIGSTSVTKRLLDALGVTQPTSTNNDLPASTGFVQNVVLNASIGAQLPGQAGNAGKFVRTDGSTASWADPLPSRTGNAGKFLTNDGDATLWKAPVVVDRAYNQQTGINSLAPKIPYDNTIPQSNEGTQYHQATITPKSTTNRIRGRVQCSFGSSWQGADAGMLAVFVNGEADARWATAQLIPDGGIGVLYLEFEYVPGVTTAQQITVRIGCNAGSIIPNGNRFGIDLGGKMTSTLVLQEITP